MPKIKINLNESTGPLFEGGGIRLSSLDEPPVKDIEHEVTTPVAATELLNGVKHGRIQISKEDVAKLVELTSDGNRAEAVKEKGKIKPGERVLRLADREVIWQTNSGSVLLNRLAGIVAVAVDPTKVTAVDNKDIQNGLKSGKITVDEETKSKDIEVETGFDLDKVSQASPTIREKFLKFILTTDISEFRNMIKGFKRVDLVTIKKLEEASENRKEYISIIVDILQTAE